MTRITFNLDNVLNGWFDENFYKLSTGRYVKREGHLVNFSSAYRLTPEGDFDTFILEKEKYK